MKTEESITALIENHMEYARKIARGQSKGIAQCVEFDDIEAYAQLGLVEAAQRWDPQGGSAFTTFAWYRIRGSVFDGLTKMSGLTAGQRKELAIRALEDSYTEESLEGAESGGAEEMAAAFSRATRGLGLVLLTSQIGDESFSFDDDAVTEQTASQNAEQNEAVNNLMAAVRRLSDKDAHLIWLLYVECQSTTEIANKRGVNKSTISRLHSKILEKIRLLMIECDDHQETQDASVMPTQEAIGQPNRFQERNDPTSQSMTY